MKLPHIFPIPCSLLLLLVVCFAALRLFGGQPEGAIVCEGTYPHHPQGVATDGASIYWSFTTVLVKTDLSGKALARFEIATSSKDHMGDLCCKGGHVFAGVNRRYSSAGGRTGDEVWEFDGDLSLVKKHPTPEAVWCNNGLEWSGDSFWVVSSAPGHCVYNFVFIYTPDFRFKGCLPIKTGWTNLGVQTILRYRDRLLFGHYGADKDATDPHRGGIFVVDMAKVPNVLSDHPEMIPCERRIPGVDASCGMIALNGRFYRLTMKSPPNGEDNSVRPWTASVVPFDIDPLLDSPATTLK